MKPRQDGGAEMLDGELMHVGGTLYYFVSDERHKYWVQKGRSMCDLDFVWKVKSDKQGREFYVNVGDRRKVWRLPDVEGESGPPSEVLHGDSDAVLSALRNQHRQSETLLSALSSPGAHAHHRRQLHTTPPQPQQQVQSQSQPQSQPLPQPEVSRSASQSGVNASVSDSQLAQAHFTIQYLWAELQKAAAEVDETRRIATETRAECMKLKEGMRELMVERDQYRSQLTTVASDVTRLTEALEQSSLEDDHKRSQVPFATSDLLTSPSVVNPTKVLLISISYAGHNQTFTALDEIGKPAGVFSPLPAATPDTDHLQSYISHQNYSPPAVTHQLTDAPNTPVSQLPTKANIMAGVDWLVMGARPGDQLLLHIKSHGKSVGEAGCFLPSDCTTSGVIRGEALLTVLCRLPHGVRVIVVADCPQELDLFDLQHRVVASDDGMARWDKQGGRGFPISADVVVVQARCPTPPSRNQSLTRAFLEALERHTTTSYLQLVVDVHRLLYVADPTNHIMPILSCNRQFDPSSIFPRLSGNPKLREEELPPPPASHTPQPLPFQSLALQNNTSRGNNLAAALSMIYSDRESDHGSRRSRSGSTCNPLPRQEAWTDYSGYTSTLPPRMESYSVPTARALLSSLSTPPARRKLDSNPLNDIPVNTLHRAPSSPPDWNPPGSLTTSYYRQY